ncbi:hypothetical protein [Microtetraspora sp. NBRC 13810]|uniref:hypothetical protein n=1 Tax=Microtetraspora sp. NBRC 13810 TaxID=3030990 RepID=UPI00255314B8|nr:hypothetical protein [Microtetraspora sp. NBRC 13810]
MSAVSHLKALADVLGSLSLGARVEDGDTPRLVVTNPRVSQLSESITVALDGDSVRQFWWSWGDPIAPVGDLHAVATRIRYVLTPTKNLP